MTEKICLRRASDEDYRAFYGKEPPLAWVGFAAVEGDAVVAFGFIYTDERGNTWGGVDEAARVPRVKLHRLTLEMLAALTEEGIEAVFATCDDRLARAAPWLERLGFAIDPSIQPVYVQGAERPIWVRRTAA
jgi:hypothetical protein